ncbi:SGNH/GDSL hydrolase family protein [Spirulina sp. CS-785/01]|uniref:SGNH/GDSL hydrolase family protein n=1 Tax=Spirulina sp. CS-785/01 TaxID=3021716 RepID=UPI002330CE9A|nr:SGNH/GDSL hydrolase family protein [Spirulina sp. CS-785/01]MDB9314827.1 SGNH/GDSL hydrolase family protein [Spirulina sp. CS-785/01]
MGWFAIAAIVLVGVILLEFALRGVFGFGNPPLYLGDEEIGYLLKPGQTVRRMGNRIEINEYSMRGETVSPSRQPGEFRVFLIGDSVANGGWWTDQGEIISQLMKQRLEQQGLTWVQVLNASANSWNPRNEAAYLRRFGLFESQVLVVLINTDDLFGTPPTALPVGRDRTYPDQKPILALMELYQRYLAPSQKIPELKAIHQEGGDRVGKNLAALAEMQEFAQQQQAQFILALTPLFREIGEPGSRDYEIKARQRLQEFCQQRNIPYIDCLPIFQNTESPDQLFRDHIHLSPSGNQLVSEVLADAIRKVES